MKRGIIIGVLGLIVLLLAGSVFILQRDNHELKATVQKKQETLDTLKRKVKDEKAVSGLNVTSKEVAFVEQMFTTYLTYDNDSYVTRFNTLSNYVQSDVLNKLKGASSLDPPAVEMKNEVAHLQLYVNPEKPHTFLVYTTTNYFLDGALVSEGSQLYEVDVLKEDEQFIIGNLKVIGNMTEVDGV